MDLLEIKNTLNAIDTLLEKLGVDDAKKYADNSDDDLVGKKVIVRSRDAGVLFGEYVKCEGSDVSLKKATQMWKWHAAKGISLIDVAEFGVDTSKSKFSKGKSDIVVVGACAIISVTPEAALTIEAVK